MNTSQMHYLSETKKHGNIRRTDVDLAVNGSGLTETHESYSDAAATGRNDFYLQYIILGKLDIWIGHKRMSLKPGQAILHYPDAPFYCESPLNGQTRYYWISFTGRRAEEVLADYRLMNQSILDLGMDPVITEAFDTLVTDHELGGRYAKYTNIMELLRIFTQIRRQDDRVDTASPRQKLHRSVSFIQSRYYEDISVRQLAELEHMSVSWYRELFRELVGCSPLTYLTDIRITKAKGLLTRSNASIAEIAYLVGYKDPLYFTRSFKKLVGTSPSEYRQLHLPTP